LLFNCPASASFWAAPVPSSADLPGPSRSFFLLLFGLHSATAPSFFALGAFVAHDCGHETRAGAGILKNLDTLPKALAVLKFPEAAGAALNASVASLNQH
jgi:hypothetical protein